MKYKVGDKAKIVDSTREEDNIIGFETGDEVTITKCFNKEQRYEITKNGVSGYIDECNLTDLSSYTWEDFLKAPIGTKVTFEDGDILVKSDADRFGNETDYTSYEYIKSFNREDGFGKIIKIEEPTYTTVYEPAEQVEEMTLEEVCKELGREIKIVKEK